jgi:hypothetical protein
MKGEVICVPGNLNRAATLAGARHAEMAAAAPCG